MFGVTLLAPIASKPIVGPYTNHKARKEKYLNPFTVKFPGGFLSLHLKNHNFAVLYFDIFILDSSERAGHDEYFDLTM